MGAIQRVVVQLNPCGTGKKDFAIHVGMAEWSGNDVIMTDFCHGNGTLQRVGVVNRLECSSCGLIITPKKGKGMTDQEFEARWAWDLLRTLGPVPEEYLMSTLPPRVMSMVPYFARVLYWPNWAESGDQLFVAGHTCQSFEDIAPAVYINEAATHNIMRARFDKLEEEAKSAMSSLYWKFE